MSRERSFPRAVDCGTATFGDVSAHDSADVQVSLRADQVAGLVAIVRRLEAADIDSPPLPIETLTHAAVDLLLSIADDLPVAEVTNNASLRTAGLVTLARYARDEDNRPSNGFTDSSDSLQQALQRHSQLLAEHTRSLRGVHDLSARITGLTNTPTISNTLVKCWVTEEPLTACRGLRTSVHTTSDIDTHGVSAGENCNACRVLGYVTRRGVHDTVSAREDRCRPGVYP